MFVPTTPNPTSGFIMMVPREEIIELDMDVESAIKMIVSLGVVVPTWSGKAAAIPLRRRRPAPVTSPRTSGGCRSARPRESLAMRTHYCGEINAAAVGHGSRGGRLGPPAA